MPASAGIPETALAGGKLGDRFKGRKKGAAKGKGAGAPKKFTGKMGNATGGKSMRRNQVLTSPPKKTKGAAVKPGQNRTAGHSMGGMFGFSPKKTESDNRPPKQSEKKADKAARTERLRHLLI